MQETTNCKNDECGALVYVTDVPFKKSGFCWRCEIKRLKNIEHAEKSMRATNHLLVTEIKGLKERLQELQAESMEHIAEKSRLSGEVQTLKEKNASLERQLTMHAKVLSLALSRLKLFVLYHDRHEIKEAIEAWLEPDEDGGSDWVNPPPAVDEALEKVEHFRVGVEELFSDVE